MLGLFSLLAQDGPEAASAVFDGSDQGFELVGESLVYAKVFGLGF